MLIYLRWSRQPLQFPVPPEQKIPLLIPLYLLAPGLIWGFSRWAGEPSLAAYGLALNSKFGLGLGQGFGAGLLGIALLFGGQWGLGWLVWQPQAKPAEGPKFASLIPILLGLTLFIGVVEELVFRGFIVDQLHQDIPWGVVVGLACGLFAVLHLVWDGAAGLPQTPGLLLMGAVLMTARWADGGSLGLAAGLHSGWIFSLALIDTLPLQRPDQPLPLWLVGRPEQPLTGLLPLLLLGATGMGLWWLGSGSL